MGIGDFNDNIMQFTWKSIQSCMKWELYNSCKNMLVGIRKIIMETFFVLIYCGKII